MSEYKLIGHNYTTPDLVAKVTGVSGTTITLDTPAQATTAGARVCIDAVPAFRPLWEKCGGGYAEAPPGVTINLPPGEFVHSQSITDLTPNTFTSRTNWKLIGSGDRGSPTETRLRQGRGCDWMNAQIAGNGWEVAHMHWVGNHDCHGYGAVTATYNVFGCGLLPQGAQQHYVHNMTWTDYAFAALGPGFCTQFLHEDISFRRETWPDERYINWQYPIANCSGPGCISRRINVWGQWLFKSFQFFQCGYLGDEGCYMEGFNGRNTITNTNSCVGVHINDFTIINEPYCWPKFVVIPMNPNGEPLMNINANQNSFPGITPLPGEGGLFENFHLEQLGYADFDGATFSSLIINITNTGHVIKGQHNHTVYNPAAKGVIIAPWTVVNDPIDDPVGGSPGTPQGGSKFGGKAHDSPGPTCQSTADVTTYNGIRVVGFSAGNSLNGNVSRNGPHPEYKGLDIRGTDATGLIITNCVSDSYYVEPTGGPTPGVLTNAAYTAL